MHISRSNEEWLAHLCGSDSQRQEQAYQELGRYLFVLGCRFLIDRQSSSTYLAGLAHPEIEALAQDAVQETLIKVWQTLCIKRTFKGKAKLTTYATTILRNEIGRLVRQRRRESHPLLTQVIDTRDPAFAEK